MRSLMPVVLAGHCAIAGCQSSTDVVIDVTTDVPCGGAQRLTTAIAAGDFGDIEARAPVATTTHCDPSTGRIGSLVLVPSGAEDARVAVRVIGAIDRAPVQCQTSAQGCIVSLRAVQFIPHETIELPVDLSARCEGVACGPLQTCVDGSCVAVEGAAGADAGPDAGSDVVP